MSLSPSAGVFGLWLRRTLVAALLCGVTLQGLAAAPEAPTAAPEAPTAALEAPTAAAAAHAAPQISFDAVTNDLSPWAMFLGADRVVKVVMSMLGVASVLTWTVWLSKSLELRQARRKLAAALKGFDEVPTLADAADHPEPVVTAMIAAARKEMAHFVTPYSAAIANGIKERIAARLERIEAAAGKRMRQGTTVLASIGATAPFVGLFGTVWGIMNSFVGISKAQTTNLAVVAPGIAEALLATALGLVAAIPAVLIYNSCVRGISGYRVLVGDASTLVMCLVSREMDRDLLDSRDTAPIESEFRRPVAVK